MTEYVRLSNTVLQRVDRSAGSHGLVAHIALLDPDVVEYAMRIPRQCKRRCEDQGGETRILRKALHDLLPPEVLWRGKARFWPDAGLGDLMAHGAAEQTTGHDFRRQRVVPTNGCEM